MVIPASDWNANSRSLDMQYAFIQWMAYGEGLPSLTFR